MIRAEYNYGSLKDRYKGKQALVFGRGYSRHEITSERIDEFKKNGGIVFICNQLLLVPEVAQRADWLVFIDTYLILNHFDEIKAWDNYASGDTSILEEQVPKTDLDCLQYCIDYGSDGCSNISNVIDGILEFRADIEINATLYSWDEIKHLFGEEE